MLLSKYNEESVLEAGCDEAGRGCLAGPVFAAAVILPQNFKNEILTDSKKLTAKKRKELRVIVECQALAWAVGRVDPKEIDEINILNASFLAMHRAIEQLKVQPEYLLIDGNRFTPYKDIPYSTIVKGDATYLSIAAASILAKTHRDEYMEEIDALYPNYDWCNNKGYPTKKHRAGIKAYGVTPFHRQSFNLLGEDQQLNIDFS